jgi:hypothetical protein
MLKWVCGNRYLAPVAAVIGLILIAGMVYIGTLADFSDNERVLDIVITGQVAGLVFLVASDLIRKTMKLQARIVKLEEHIARLGLPPAP